MASSDNALQKKKIDIIALQETHTVGSLQQLSAFRKFRTYESKFSPTIRGVAFVVLNPHIKIIKDMDHKDGMIYTLKIAYGERKMTLVCVYAPPYKRTQAELFARIHSFWNPSQEILFLGDWNFVENPKQDSVGPHAPLPTPGFRELRQNYELTDVRLIKKPHYHITRWNINHTAGNCLDRIYVSPQLKMHIRGMSNQPVPCQLTTSRRHTASDHQMISVTISAASITKARPY